MSEIADTIYRCTQIADLSTIKKDISIFNILTAMDGHRSVRTIAQENSYELEFLIEKVRLLAEKGLLLPVKNHHGGETVVGYMLKELTRLLGPVAGELLKKSATTLGHDLSGFPEDMVPQLTDMVTRFIQEKSKAAEFKMGVLDRIT